MKSFFSLKKIIALSAFSLCFQFLPAAGTSLGFSSGVQACTADFSDAGIRWEASLLYKRETFPFYFAGKASFSGLKADSFFFNADYWIADPRLGSSIIHWFYGPGLTLGFCNMDFCPRLRFVTGLNFFSSWNLEWFFQLAAEGGCLFASKIEPSYAASCEAGVRFYF